VVEAKEMLVRLGHVFDQNSLLIPPLIEGRRVEL